MNIGLVSPYSWDIPGGVNRHVEQLALYLRERGHRVTVIAPGGLDDEGFYSAGGSFPVSANRSVANISFGPRVAARVRRFVTANPFDVLHLHEPLVPSVSMLALLYSRAANVGTFHAAREGGSLGYFLARPLLKSLASRLHLRAAVSEAALNLVSRYFPGEYRILPNGVDTRNFRPDGPTLVDLQEAEASREKARPEAKGEGRIMGEGEGFSGSEEKGTRGKGELEHTYGDALRRIPVLERDAFYIIFVGREEPRKGLQVLLRALPRIRRTYPEVRLLVVGVEDTGKRGEGVIWLGRLPDAVLPAAYRTARLMVAPALGRESFGIVLLEAMACGLPVVASDISGYRSVVQSGVQGLLVPPGDVEALAEAVVSLVKDEARRERMAEAGLARADDHSWYKLVIKVEEAYLEAVRVKSETSV